ncbi:hypothetical protein OSCI_2780028 [Kamptonema sp. PCC 6506]|nr:hypothetical protein OSCI_2780028 [Kamptonema sp. PCC 6506]
MPHTQQAIKELSKIHFPYPVVRPDLKEKATAPLAVPLQLKTPSLYHLDYSRASVD